MSRVSKLLNDLALRRKQAAEALFESNPVVQMRRVLHSEPVIDQSIDRDLTGRLLLAMQDELKEALAKTPYPRVEPSIHTRKEPEAKSLHAPTNSRVRFKKRPYNRWGDDCIQGLMLFCVILAGAERFQAYVHNRPAIHARRTVSTSDIT